MICNPGLLNRKVTIYRPSVEAQDGLDSLTDKVLYSNVSAWIAPVRGIQYKEDGTDRNDATVKITIRYRKGITDGCWVKYKDHHYLVEWIADPDMQHESLELMCIERLRGDPPESKLNGWEP
jgi:SPP1 family predicted phage head-tail adaptor